MLARLVASWLVVVAILPFTAPFSTITLHDILSSCAVRQCAADAARTSHGSRIVAPDLAGSLLRVDVRPVASSQGDPRLMLFVLPRAGALVSALAVCGRATEDSAERESTATRRLTILRL